MTYGETEIPYAAAHYRQTDMVIPSPDYVFATISPA